MGALRNWAPNRASHCGQFANLQLLYTRVRRPARILKEIQRIRYYTHQVKDWLSPQECEKWWLWGEKWHQPLFLSRTTSFSSLRRERERDVFETLWKWVYIRQPSFHFYAFRNSIFKLKRLRTVEKWLRENYVKSAFIYICSFVHAWSRKL